MKIATITFHWATNYGAVIQAYALQKFLQKQQVDTEIIQYLPRQNMILQRVCWLRDGRLDNFKKEKKIRAFRRRHLKVSSKKYSSNRQLLAAKDVYDVVICGSDQIWNFSFVEYAERNSITTSYYLNFVGSKTRRIGYAVSFGTDSVPEKFKSIIKKELEQFAYIGVREKTAQSMLSEMSVENQMVLDPTLLLKADDYNKLLTEVEIQQPIDFFPYLLHENQKMAEQFKKYIFQSFEDIETAYNNESLSVEEWLFYEKNAKFILTNSFHSTVFAIIFHTPFIVVPVEGSNMDDRIKTLLSIVNLDERFVTEYNEDEIERLLKKDLDWAKVDSKLEIARKKSQDFLLHAAEMI